MRHLVPGHKEARPYPERTDPPPPAQEAEWLGFAGLWREVIPIDYWGGLREVLCLQLCGDHLNVTGEPNWTQNRLLPLPLSRRKSPRLIRGLGAGAATSANCRSQRRRSGRRKGAKRIRHSGCRSRLPLRCVNAVPVDPDSIPAVREARHALLGAPGMDPHATDGRSDDAVFVGTSGRSSPTPCPPCVVIAAPLPRPSDAFARVRRLVSA